jgi:hypothetical protein
MTTIPIYSATCKECRLCQATDEGVTCWAMPPRIEGEYVVRGVTTEPGGHECYYFKPVLSA